MNTTIPASTVDEQQNRWRVGWPELGVAVGVALVLYAIGIAIIVNFPEDQPIVLGFFQFALSGLAPLGGAAAAVLVRIRDVRIFGFRRVSLKWVLVAAAVGLGVVGLNLILTTIVTMLNPDMQNVQANYQSAAAGGLLPFLGAILLGAMLTPLGEEALFRGVLANFLDRFGPWVAVLGSSTIFALAHGINYVLPVAFVVGLAAVLLMRRTGSIWPGVIVHAVNNASGVIIPLVYAMT